MRPVVSNIPVTKNIIARLGPEDILFKKDEMTAFSKHPNYPSAAGISLLPYRYC
jgi:hypothetical protein